jgi:hypothetical protein
MESLLVLGLIVGLVVMGAVVLPKLFKKKDD